MWQQVWSERLRPKPEKMAFCSKCGNETHLMKQCYNIHAVCYPCSKLGHVGQMCRVWTAYKHRCVYILSASPIDSLEDETTLHTVVAQQTTNDQTSCKIELPRVRQSMFFALNVWTKRLLTSGKWQISWNGVQCCSKLNIALRKDGQNFCLKSKFGTDHTSTGRMSWVTVKI